MKAVAFKCVLTQESVKFTFEKIRPKFCQLRERTYSEYTSPHWYKLSSRPGTISNYRALLLANLVMERRSFSRSHHQEELEVDVVEGSPSILFNSFQRRWRGNLRKTSSDIKPENIPECIRLISLNIPSSNSREMSVFFSSSRLVNLV